MQLAGVYSGLVGADYGQVKDHDAHHEEVVHVQAQDGGVDVPSQAQFDALEVEVATKAVAAVVATDLQALTDAVADKADKTDVDALTTTVSTKAAQADLALTNTTVQGLGTAVGLKADQTALNTTNGTVGQLVELVDLPNRRFRDTLTNATYVNNLRVVAPPLAQSDGSPIDPFPRASTL